MKPLFLILAGLGLASSALATVSIEFQLGGIEVPSGSIGVLVADVNNDGFTDPDSASGAVLSPGEAFGPDDVVIAVFSNSALPDWGSQKGFAEHLTVLDYAALGVAAGNPLILHVFPDRTEGGSVRSGEPHLSYRADQIGELTSTSNMGFALPTDGGAYLLAAIAPDKGGNADLAGLNLQNLPYSSGNGSFDRSLSPTAVHTYYFELGQSGFLTLEGIGGQGLVAELIGPGGQSVFSGGGDTFAFYDTLPTGLYSLVLSRENGGSGDLAYELDFADSDIRFVVPDVAVGKSLTSLIGENILNGTGGQTLSLVSVKARPVSASATVGNQGQLSDTLAVRGGGGNALCSISFFDGSGNVSAGIVAGTYRTEELVSGDTPTSLSVKFSPNKRKLTKKKGRKTKILKKTFSTFVRADSTQGPASMDSATVRVQTR